MFSSGPELDNKDETISLRSYGIGIVPFFDASVMAKYIAIFLS